MGPIGVLLDELYPGSTVVSITRLGTDPLKATGYGVPMRIRTRDRDGRERDFVLHTASPNDYGHDRRADRAAEMLLAFDTYHLVGQHVAAHDVGAIMEDGSLRSLRQAGELYLLTEFAEGQVYAEHLRRLAGAARLDSRDRARCVALARYLARLHQTRADRPAVYVRSIRDLVGDGEGIYGIVDGYPADCEAAPPARLAEIERRCARWRWRLRGQEHRLARKHGDFHPFNIVFGDDDQLRLLDASRGCWGDPADDVTCLAINYPFFALADESSWQHTLGPLWQLFWSTYLAETGDDELLAVAPPFLAWRVLVLANPTWYPSLSAQHRDALLTLAETALDAGGFDPTTVEVLFS